MSEWVKVKKFACDFETTVFNGQTDTSVWSSALVEIGAENDVIILGSIEKTFAFLSQQRAGRIICYYHNLKFDGTFWLDFLLRNKNLKQAFVDENNINEGFCLDFDMPENTYKYSISAMGMFYTITIRLKNKFIEFRDSLKLLPFNLRTIGKSFNTKHQKLEMVYEGRRYPNCPITEDEKAYIKNDVLLLKEALEVCFSKGHDKLTIGSCCISEYKKIVKDSTKIDVPLQYSDNPYDWLFTDLTQIEIDENLYGAKNADEFIRKSYRGGWCYVDKRIKGKIINGGCCIDVNSLYPSVMHSDLNYAYPVNIPYFFYGSIPDNVKNNNNYYYFVKIKTRFKLRAGFLPCIQIKNNLFYKANEWLDSSDFTVNRTKINNAVELTLTMTDYELIKKHYHLIDCVELCGCYFYTQVGIFDEYINKYAEIKRTTKNAERTLAKLFLNNLYGKTATSTDSSFKTVYLKDNALAYQTHSANNKKAGYIAVGSAITSYARNFTITHAQDNYSVFCYSDTDSVHCNCTPDDLNNIDIDDIAFGCWKIENLIDVGKYVRQKTYIEIDNGEYIIKCAGMPDNCKKILADELKNGSKTLDDFDIGLKIYGKLMPKRIKGGTLLVPTTFEMK